MGKVLVDFCCYYGEVYGVVEGWLMVMKSDKDVLIVGEDGFFGLFVNEGDKVSWQVQVLWSGQFLFNVIFNGKWGGKQNLFVVNGVVLQVVVFLQMDEQGQQLWILVMFKVGSNQIDFGCFVGDWGYMFIKLIEVVVEQYVQVVLDGCSFFLKERLCSSISFCKGFCGGWWCLVCKWKGLLISVIVLFGIVGLLNSWSDFISRQGCRLCVIFIISICRMQC